MTFFRSDPDIFERFPAVVSGVIHATGVHNDPTPPRLVAINGLCKAELINPR